MKDITPIEGIENQLNKIFGGLGSCYSTKVSFILSKLDLSQLAKEINRFQLVFTIESLLKLYLWKRIKGIKYHAKVLEELTKNQHEAFNLGFQKNIDDIICIPKKRTFNEFLQKSLRKDIREFLDIIAQRIISLSTKNKIILDLNIVEKEIKKHNDNIKKQKKIKEATRLVKKLVYPQIDIKIKENGKFTTKNLLDVLVHIAQTHDFCNNGSLTFKELNPELKAPHGNTLMYHFRKFRYTEQIKDIFENVFDVIFNFAKQNYKELRRRQLDIAIDIHKIPYYGNKNDPYVAEGKHERGTTHFFKFITCSIVVAGRRFIIDAIPMHKLDVLEDLTDVLIKRAKSKISINRIYLDREFDKPNVINILNKNKLNFIMPKIRTETVKSWMRKSEDCKSRVIENFEIGRENKAIVNLILVDDEEGIKRAFITNFHVPEQLTHYLYFWYSKRWGIETSYRNMDHDFKPRTTSKNYNIRLFYFLFTVCLYNLWVLVNICISLALYKRLVEKPVITAKLFSIILYRVQIDPGGT